MFASMSNLEQHTFITKPEVAMLLRCSLGTVDNYMKNGYIHSYGFGRRVIFKKEEIIADLIRR